uniref:RING-type domain-containing protein n=1 Tax=Myripristis murdjan TaxID=586833 RepID=A0A667X251_9TELE
MACASSLLTEEQFLCSICMDVFTNPAAIPCGHNFCLQCITNYWDTSNICQCPLCLEQFYKRPMLRVNIFIAEMAAKFKKTIGEKSSGSAEQQLCAKVFICVTPACHPVSPIHQHHRDTDTQL